jgi:hypothetical protein
MDGGRESDRFVVLRKPANKGHPMGSAEQVEGREWATGNVAEHTRSWIQRRGFASGRLPIQIPSKLPALEGRGWIGGSSAKGPDVHDRRGTPARGMDNDGLFNTVEDSDAHT